VFVLQAILRRCGPSFLICTAQASGARREGGACLSSGALAAVPPAAGTWGGGDAVGMEAGRPAGRGKEGDARGHHGSDGH
jgi:hypothetical protein